MLHISSPETPHPLAGASSHRSANQREALAIGGCRTVWDESGEWNDVSLDLVSNENRSDGREQTRRLQRLGQIAHAG